ncbi:MAG: ATP-binding cassette domain-containing protein [Ilumatobacteraceae bacterium]
MIPEAIADTPALEGIDLVKRFGSVVALHHADLAVFAGEVLAIVGDNGSGKTTLIKCLSGAEVPDRGEVRIEGSVMRFRTANDGRISGINTVYQSLAVQPALDIASSLFRGHALTHPGHVDKGLRWLEAKGVKKPAAALASKVIVLDEPTAALGERESTQVLKLIDNLRGRGLPIIVATHNLKQVFKIADRIHVQREGKRAAVVSPHDFTITDVLSMMSGSLQVDSTDQATGPVR